MSKHTEEVPLLCFSCSGKGKELTLHYGQCNPKENYALLSVWKLCLPLIYACHSLCRDCISVAWVTRLKHPMVCKQIHCPPMLHSKTVILTQLSSHGIYLFMTSWDRMWKLMCIPVKVKWCRGMTSASSFASKYDGVLVHFIIFSGICIRIHIWIHHHLNILPPLVNHDWTGSGAKSFGPVARARWWGHIASSHLTPP